MAEPNGLCDRISGLFGARMHLTVPSIGTDLFDTGLLDSLSLVTLLLHLEEEFGLTASIEDLEYENFRSVARIAEFVAARTEVRAGS